MISRWFFFIFQKTLIFWAVLGGRRWENSVMLHISRTIHRMIVMVRLCKTMKTPVVFFIFSKFSFPGLLGGAKGKNWSKTRENSVALRVAETIHHMVFSVKCHNPKWLNYICHAPRLRNRTSYDFHLWYTCVKWKYLQWFFLFSQNFDFAGF